MKVLIGVALLLALGACSHDAAHELAQGRHWLEHVPASAATGARARQHLLSAANMQSSAAAYHLGLLYRRGALGLPVDQVAALRWLRVAAEAGVADAQFMLGQMLAAGEGGPSDALQARQWFEKAAEAELPEAQLELALAYQRGGLGVAPDQSSADRHLMEAQHALKHRPARP